MAGRRGLLHVAQGSAFLLNGVGWTVEVMEPQHGRLTLVHADGHRESRSIRWLVHHPDARVLSEAVGGSRPAGQPWTLADLGDSQLDRARIRAEHVLEATTGFRDGRAERTRPGERGRPTIRSGRR